MGTDFTTLEKLYARGVLDINGKDFINGGNSAVNINPQRDTFLPDNRFAQVDGGYIRNLIDKDTFNYSTQYNSNENYAFNINDVENTNSSPSSKKNVYIEKAKKLLLNDVTAGVIGIGALLLSGRYILKKLHILK